MYQNAKIYQIVGNVENSKRYIGSTVQPLSKRMGCHRDTYRTINTYTSREIFDEYGIENCSIVLIENFPCDSKEELFKRERYWIETMDCVNKCIPTRTKKERYEDNKEEILNKMKIYRNSNKDEVNERIRKIKQNNKDYYEEQFICECGGKYKRCSKTVHFKTKKHQKYISTIKLP